MQLVNSAVATTAVALILTLAGPAEGSSRSDLDACLIESVRSARDTDTVGELRDACESKAPTPAGRALPVYEESALQERIAAESDIEQRPFAITPHEPNYIQWTSFNPNQAPFVAIAGIPDPVDDQEVKYQVSIKAPVWRNMFGRNIDTYFAYTATSWWQVSNDAFSSPFRETNYQPEVFVRSFTGRRLLGMNVGGWSIGLNHQSNGHSELLNSRSWNRVLGRVGIGVGDDLTLLLRAWYRLPEDAADDDNPGMYRFYGYGDIRAIWTPNRNTLTAMVRPGTQKTSFELTWSFPINKVFRVYATYHDGYGESLLDYNYDIRRFGIGIALNDYLQR